VATVLDVSVATIYRAVKTGRLRAERIGTGTGAVRILGEAIATYRAECERAAVTLSSASPIRCATCETATSAQSVDASGGAR
jgi:excisionase family DNA binding protein